ncbi:hypothetical protein ACFL5U_01370 [Candidatus Margulisiibacteriota bacterium]
MSKKDPAQITKNILLLSGGKPLQAREDSDALFVKQPLPGNNLTNDN